MKERIDKDKEREFYLDIIPWLWNLFDPGSKYVQTKTRQEEEDSNKVSFLKAHTYKQEIGTQGISFVADMQTL